jgi:hypothetical protein
MKLLVTFSLLSLGLMAVAQDDMQLVPWNCTADGTGINAMPLSPNSVDIQLDIMIDSYFGTERVLKTTIYEDMQASIQYNEVSGDGLHTFRIHLTKNVTNSSWMGTYLYLELLSLPDSTPQASLSIGAITVVLPEPTISLTSATSDADEVEAQVSATPYNIAMSLCPDEQSYVMLEAIDEYGGTMLFTDSIVENYNTLPMTPTTYSFETNYSGSATTACLRTFIRVRNVVDGSFEDLVPSDTVCGIELGTALSVTDHFIQTKTPGTYQLFDMGGKLVEMGRCTLGEKELGNHKSGTYVLMLIGDDETMERKKIYLAQN